MPATSDKISRALEFLKPPAGNGQDKISAALAILKGPSAPAAVTPGPRPPQPRYQVDAGGSLVKSFYPNEEGPAVVTPGPKTIGKSEALRQRITPGIRAAAAERASETRGSLPSQAGRALARGTFGQGSKFMGGIAEMTGDLLGIESLKTIGEEFKAAGEFADLMFPAAGHEDVTMGEKIVGVTFEAAPMFAAQIGAAGLASPIGMAYAGFIAVGVGPVVTQQYVDAKEFYLADGRGEKEARGRAVVDSLTAGMITAVTNLLPAKFVVGPLKGVVSAAAKRVSAAIALGAFAEGTQEVVEDTLTEIMEALRRGEMEKLHRIGSAEWIQEKIITFAAGAALGGAARSVTAKVGKKPPPPAAEPKVVAEGKPTPLPKPQIKLEPVTTAELEGLPPPVEPKLVLRPGEAQAGIEFGGEKIPPPPAPAKPTPPPAAAAEPTPKLKEAPLTKEPDDGQKQAAREVEEVQERSARAEPPPPRPKQRGKVATKANSKRALQKLVDELPSALEQSEDIIRNRNQRLGETAEVGQFSIDHFALHPDDLDGLSQIDKARIKKMGVPISEDADQLRDFLGDDLFEAAKAEILGGKEGRFRATVTRILDRPDGGWEPQDVLNAWHHERQIEVGAAKATFMDNPQSLQVGDEFTILGDRWLVKEIDGRKLIVWEDGDIGLELAALTSLMRDPGSVKTAAPAPAAAPPTRRPRALKREAPLSQQAASDVAGQEIVTLTALNRENRPTHYKPTEAAGGQSWNQWFLIFSRRVGTQATMLDAKALFAAGWKPGDAVTQHRKGNVPTLPKLPEKPPEEVQVKLAEAKPKLAKRASIGKVGISFEKKDYVAHEVQSGELEPGMVIMHAIGRNFGVVLKAEGTRVDVLWRNDANPSVTDTEALFVLEGIRITKPVVGGQPGLLGEQFAGAVTGKQQTLALPEPSKLGLEIEKEAEARKKRDELDETLPLAPEDQPPLDTSPHAAPESYLAGLTDDQIRQVAEGNNILNVQQADRVELLDSLAVLAAVTKGKDATRLRNSIDNARRGMINLDLFTKPVIAALKVGKWTADQTKNAARWVFHALGANATHGQARRSLIARFGTGIKRWFGDVWIEYRAIVPDKELNSTIFQSGEPASQATIEKLASLFKAAPKFIRSFEALKHEQRKTVARAVGKAQKGKKGEVGFRRARAAMKGQLERPVQDFEPIAVVGTALYKGNPDGLTDAEIGSLVDHVNNHVLLDGRSLTANNLTGALVDAIRQGHIPTDSQIDGLSRVLGPKVAKALAGKRSLGKRLGRVALEVISLPKALVASMDLSATLRQGLFPTIDVIAQGRPDLVGKAFWSQIRAFGSKKYSENIDTLLRTRDLMNLGDQAGLELTSSDASDLTMREEQFFSHLAEKIPGVAASQRAFITYLNMIRVAAFDGQARRMLNRGLTPESDMRSFKELGKAINAAAGRSNVKKYGDIAVFVNATFFSPRFIMSRFEYPYRLVKGLTVPGMRGWAVRQLIADAAFLYGIMAFLDFAKDAFGWDDVEFGTDPRGPRFLKVIHGDTTIDVSAGMGPPIRLIAETITGQRLNPQTKRLEKSNVIIAGAFFLRNKTSPTASMLVSLQTGKRFGNKPIRWTPDMDLSDLNDPQINDFGIIGDLIIPIPFETAVEVVNEHGAKGLWYLLPETLGAGVNVYEPPRRGRRSTRPHQRRSTKR